MAEIPTEIVAFWMFAAITAVIGVKVLTGTLLNRQRKTLATINEKLRDIRLELEHARERTKGAGNETTFLERRKVELDRDIPDTQKNLEELSSSLDSDVRDEVADPLLPRHMRPRDEGLSD